MRHYKLLIWIIALLPMLSVAQEETTTEKPVDKPERAAFESALLIDNNTDVTFIKGTLEVVMQHRFGTLDGGTNDLLGIWAPANIRLALMYSFTDNITLGAGTTKDGRMQDFNAKVALLRQTRSGSIPFNISYFGNMAIDARKKDNFRNVQDRYSFFNQLIISRRVNSNLSIQVAPSIAHYNLVAPGDENDLMAVSLGARYKISPQTAIMVDYTQPSYLLFGGENKREPGLSLGVEFATSAHAFQIYLTNNKDILNQRSQFNQTAELDFDNLGKQFMLGFTITRRYNF